MRSQGKVSVPHVQRGHIPPLTLQCVMCSVECSKGKIKCLSGW